MSNAIFPSLPGLMWNNSKAPEFTTKTHRAVSGREQRASFQQYPLWTFSLTYEFLRDTAAFPELDTLAGFFLARQGSFDSFLYADPSDSSVTDMGFGAGNGVQTQFQLVRAYGAGGNAFVEPVQNVNVLTNIKVAGIVKTLGTDYTVSATGLISFTAAPASGAALTWTGSYYYRVRFTNDSSEYSQFLQNLWEAKKVEFVGAIGNKV